MTTLTDPAENAAVTPTAATRRRRSTALGADEQLAQAFERLERTFAEALARLKPGHRGRHDILGVNLSSYAIGNAALLQRVPQVPVMRTLDLAKKALRLEPNPAIDEALRATTQAHLEALGKAAGFTPPMLEVLGSLLDATVDARAMQRQIELHRALETLVQRGEEAAAPAAPMASAGDPADSLSARELGRALGDLSEDTVRLRERRGELFSILRAGRKRGRQYPAFQSWPGIAGEPLREVLAAFGNPSGPVAYAFFTSPSELLAGLTPIEALLGKLTSARDIEPAAQRLLGEPAERRMSTAMQAARTEAVLQEA